MRRENREFHLRSNTVAAALTRTGVFTSLYRATTLQDWLIERDPRLDHELSFTRDLPLTQKAVLFARERHAGQVRDADHAPFVIHPLEAASMVERSGYPDHVVAAAVLHDVLEDTDTQRRELRERFGPEVAELVEVLSDDPAITDQDARRDEVRERVRLAGGDALVIYAADKVSKVRELRALIVGGLDPVAAESKGRHYTKCLAMLEDSGPDDRLVELLRFELEALEALPPRTAPQA